MAIKALDEVTVTDLTDIDSLVTWYALTSSTTPPTKPSTTQTSASVSSPWTTTEPSFDPAQGTRYLYTVVQTRWKDDSCTWGDVQLSSSYEQAKAAWNKANSASAAAEDGAKTATNFITAVDSNGIKVHAANNANSNYAAIDATGMEVVRGGTSMAKFGETTRIGENNKSHIMLDYHSMQLIDKNHNRYFYVSDLREEDGTVEIVETFDDCDGDKTRWNLQYEATSRDYDVLVTEAGDDVTRFINHWPKYFTIDPAPLAGDVVTVTYRTASDDVKAYTFGTRDDGVVGGYSYVLGKACVASGRSSHAEGNRCVASGAVSHAEGDYSKATGSISHAEGEQTNASAYASHSEGYLTTASGYYSHSEGYGTTASGGIYEEEFTVEIVGGTHAEGRDTTASGAASHSEGRGATASGHYSHAEGLNTIASGEASHAEGAGATASGAYSHAEGHGTASGLDAHAEGFETLANGDGSHAQNRFTIASKQAQTALGTFNIEDTAITTTHPSGTTSYGEHALIIGNGTGQANRSNAATIDWNGNYLGQAMAGIIQMFAGATPPSGWLVCDGSAVSRTEYATLYSAIGDTWGAGDGSTTFNLPDLRGRAPIGAGAGSGLTARTLGTQNIGSENVQAHTHSISRTTNVAVSDSGHTHPAATSNYYYVLGSATFAKQGGTAQSGSSGLTNAVRQSGTVSSNKNTGSGHASLSVTQPVFSVGAVSGATTGTAGNMQPSAVVNFIICTGKTS